MDRGNKAQAIKDQIKCIEKEACDKPTAAKQISKIVFQAQKQDRPVIRSFTPTRQQFSFENSLSAVHTQDYIFLEAISSTIERNQRAKTLKQMDERITFLNNRVTKLERVQNKIISSRRIRRKSAQIEKVHRCPSDRCGKNYGTETALKKHMRSKHSISTIEEDESKQ